MSAIFAARSHACCLLLLVLAGQARAQEPPPAMDPQPEATGAVGADPTSDLDRTSVPPVVPAAEATPSESTPTPAQVPVGAHTTTRKRDASYGEMFAGPFQSSRLFSMPIADVVGAFQLSLSGDGSLLRETGLLSSAGVLAIGFGDIAQLEYRHTGVIGVEKTTAPIPAIGVQVKIPYPEHKYLPALAVAFRLGRARTEKVESVEVEEKATDLYVVARLKLWGPLRVVTLHGGLRVASASLRLEGSDPVQRTMYLPAGGWEIKMNRRTRLIGEISLVPTFEIGPDVANPVPDIDYGVLGRMGIRWFVHPSFAIDASVGYQLEVAQFQGTADRGANAVVEWDIRLGAEAFLPWGAIVCRAAGIFCE